MNNVKVSNCVFSLGLTIKELAVYTYLCSIPTYYKKVAQATIAASCGFKTSETASRIIKSLMLKGMVSEVIYTVKQDGCCGSNIYVIQDCPTEDNFFFFPRKLFKMGLGYKEIAVLLFQYKAYSPERGVSWNSYNDMAKTLKMKRSDVMAIVKSLIEKRLLRKRLFRSHRNRNVFSDNHYTVIWFYTGTVNKSSGACPLRIDKPTKTTVNNTLYNSYYTTSSYDCQYINNKRRRKTKQWDEYCAADKRLYDFCCFLQRYNNFKHGKGR